MAVRAQVLGVIAALLLVAARAVAQDGPESDAAEPEAAEPGAAQPEAAEPRGSLAPGPEEDTPPPGVRRFQQVLFGVFRDAQTQAVSVLGQTHLTGEWGGWRTRLREWGVVPSATYFTDILGNPVGGKVGKVRYAHDIGVDLLLDFERMLKWKGSRFRVSMSSRSGNNLSADIGNVFTVAEVCCQLTTRLVTFAWEQSLLEHRLNVRIGRLSTGDDFLTSPLYVLFVNSDLDGNPFAPLINVPYSAYPGSAWGARVRGRPLSPIYVAAGVYDGDASATRNAAHGADLNFGDDGVLLTFEAGYEPAHHIEGALPGHYSVGGYYHTGRFRRFDAAPSSDLPSAVEHGNGGYYFLVDQMLFREVGTQGLWPFAAVTLAPNDEINTMPVFVGGGMSYQGLIPGRDHDISIASVVYGGFSGDIGRSPANPQLPQDFEMVIEWAYIIQLAPWLHLQPDFQYIIDPGGTGTIPDALVIGAQIGVNL
jgi:porin